MFSPKRLGSLGLGSDPKLAFRTQPGGIAKLAEKKEIAETDDAYWAQYVQLFDSASDVFTLIAAQDIRRALTEAPENLATLISVISHRLFNLLTDHTFPAPQATAIPLSMAKISSWTSNERNTTKEVLNCLRVLGRVLPVIFESEGSFEEDVFWTRPNPQVRDEDISSGRSQPQFVIEEEEEEDVVPNGSQDPGHKSGQNASSTNDADHVKQQELPTLAERLFECAIDLMFCCGFTLPTSIQVDHHKINYVIWDKGIGSASAIGSTSQLDSNKTEVLRFLLILLSRTIYHSPSTLLTQRNKYASHLVHKTPRRLVLSILCSLLNTAMDGEGSEGWSGMVDRVPYNHLILASVRKGDEGRSGLISLCLGVLCALLDYQADEARDPTQEANTNGTLIEGNSTSPTSHSNAFRYFVAKLHRPADFEFILDGILGILESDLTNTHNMLPGSHRPLPYILETFVFLWKMIELNKKFRSYLLESDKLLDTIAYLLCFCLENKDKPQHHGLCRALSYIMQSLSAERQFGAQLQSPMPSRVHIPAKWATLGNAGDFLISSIYSVVATTSGALNSLYPALIIAIANVAPYLKHLSVKTSTRLVQLFTAFSNPVFLLADDGHPRLVFFMLEALNGILFHQLSNNPNLVYAILRSHSVFEELGTFTLSKGLREVRRIQEMKEERAAQLAGKKPGKSTSPTGTATNATKAPEKVALLQRSSEEADVALDAAERGEVARESSEVTSTRAVPPPPSAQPSRTTSPDPLEPAVGAQNPGLSEKARGKMRERSVSSEALDPDLERIAAQGVGRNGFIPTQEWVTSWQQGLPLDPILLTIAELLPKVTDLQKSGTRPATSSAVLEFLRSATLRHVLPPAPPVNPRRFQWSDASLVWLTSLIWGELYVRGTAPLGIWNGTNVKLFGVRHTPQPRGMGETVQNVVGGLWGSAGARDSQGGTPTRMPPSRSNSFPSTR